MSDGGLWRLTAPGVAAVVDLGRGGRLASLRIDDVEILGAADLDEDLPFLDGCFPMAPYAGRIGGGVLAWQGAEYRLPLVGGPHAIHGTVLDRPWRRGDDGVLRCNLEPPWPWPGEVTQHWSLAADGLTAVLTVVAAGTPFPAWIGYHPWFRRRIERPDGGVAVVELDVRPAARYRRGADGLPTGELVEPGPHPWDDCVVGLAASPRLTWPGWLRLTIASDASHWVVYDERPEAICVEPQTGPPDAVRLGEAAVVPAHGAVSLTMRWRWDRLAPGTS